MKSSQLTKQYVSIVIMLTSVMLLSPLLFINSEADETAIFAINSGGPAYTDVQFGTNYQADTDYAGGATYSTSAGIAGTPDPSLFQTLRFGNFTYNIPIPNGSYIVVLRFAETYWNAAGKRIFNVSVQGGQQSITNVDVYALVGRDTPWDYRSPFPVTVSNGTLSIAFTSVVDNAIVNAIVILPASRFLSGCSGIVDPNPTSTFTNQVRNGDFGSDCLSELGNPSGCYIYQTTNQVPSGSETAPCTCTSLSPGESCSMHLYSGGQYVDANGYIVTTYNSTGVKTSSRFSFMCSQ